MTLEDPSHLKRFVSRCEDGSLRRVFRQEVSPKVTKIIVERYNRVVATATTGLRSLTIA